MVTALTTMRPSLFQSAKMYSGSLERQRRLHGFLAASNEATLLRKDTFGKMRVTSKYYCGGNVYGEMWTVTLR